jgi:GNAT acetyltransferase-like protein
VLDPAGRIASTREPQANPGPVFFLVRSVARCAWAVRTDVAAEVADELNSLAREEPPLSDLQDAPVHADRYKSLIAGRVKSGAAFTFPQAIDQPSDVVVVEDEQLLERHFQGWVVGEIGAGRAPVLALIENGYPVSVCFSARRSTIAAEAGVETAVGFRGRGLGPRVTAAWALAVRASGWIPLYSTDSSNEPSLAVARKLSLDPYAVDWSVWD